MITRSPVPTEEASQTSSQTIVADECHTVQSVFLYHRVRGLDAESYLCHNNNSNNMAPTYGDELRDYLRF